MVKSGRQKQPTAVVPDTLAGPSNIGSSTIDCLESGAGQGKQSVSCLL